MRRPCPLPNDDHFCRPICRMQGLPPGHRRKDQHDTSAPCHHPCHTLRPSPARAGRCGFECSHSGRPQLSRYTEQVLSHRLLADQDRLTSRDRSLLTGAALVATRRTDQLERYVATVLDSGVTPEELSELVTHLAFYAGRPVAAPAIDRIATVLADRVITAGVTLDPELLPCDSDAEAARLASVDQTARPVSPGLADATDELLFTDLWRRPGLAPRDRSLVTVAALITNGQTEQLPFHLNRARDSGLTFYEAAEIPHQLAYYAGWPTTDP